MEEISPSQPGDARIANGDLTLDLLKALGDDTRFSIFNTLSATPAGLTTAELAADLQLHPNTVRPHLERLVDAGLVERTTPHRGAVGRPQHRFVIAADAPTLAGGEHLNAIARLAMRLAQSVGASAADARRCGAMEAAALLRADAVGPDADQTPRPPTGDSGVDALMDQQRNWGFDPAITAGPVSGSLHIRFDHCPFGDLAEEQTAIACGLHQGMLEGIADVHPDTTLLSFQPVNDSTTCYALVSADAD